MSKYLKINEKDNVVVCLEAVKAGDEIALSDGSVIKAREDIPSGHKMSVKEIRHDQEVIKYGFPIGRVTENTEPGSWIHTHNTKTKLDVILQYEYRTESDDISGKLKMMRKEKRFFHG